jgi:fructose-1,6-bisphosphatase/inositol monophosphatase family enzyme
LAFAPSPEQALSVLRPSPNARTTIATTRRNPGDVTFEIILPRGRAAAGTGGIVLDRVEQIVREVAAEVVLPKFRKLAAHEILEKAAGDTVTVADRASEAMLAKRLRELLPEAQVVGEEDAAADPTVLYHLVGADPVWVVDPIDGTGNFAAGREPFGIMVALVRKGIPVLSVIYEPVPDVISLAEAGSGAFVDGVRRTMTKDPIDLGSLRGSVLTRYLPAALCQRVTKGIPHIGKALPGHHCAAREYPDVVRDVQNFALFWRAHPWDHAAGALLVREAGGVMRRFDGSDYIVGDGLPGLIAARDQQTFDLVRHALID